MAEEIWKDIRGYEGYYQVSTFGNVRSSDRTVTSKFGPHVRCINDGKVHNSAVEAANYYGIPVNCVCDRCKDGKTVNGFSFEYFDMNYYKRKHHQLLHTSLLSSYKA